MSPVPPEAGRLEHRAKSRAALSSIISNSSLVALKVAAGLLTGSVAIISEAVHSGLDLLAALMAFLAVHIAGKPPDHSHPFGHGKAENLAALFEGLLILVAGALIVHQSILGFIQPGELPSLGWGLLVMLISALVNIAVSRHLFKVGKRADSPALVADAWHLRTDVYTSLGVFVGLGGVLLGQHFHPAWQWRYLDPICALVVAFLILKAGVSLVWGAMTNLVDQSLGAEELKLIEDHICELAPKIKGFRNLRTRRSGPFRFVEVDLLVDGDLTVSEAHALGDKVIAGIREHYPQTHITVHLEPGPKTLDPLRPAADP